MKKQYKIWVGDGSAIDGTTYESRAEACEALREWRQWHEIHTAEYCDGSAICCYASQDAADADHDGAYADTVVEV
jgi:hypothetical protein